MARFYNGATAGTSAVSQSPGQVPFAVDLTTADHMRLPPNRCGGVVELDLSPIDWRPYKARVLLAGTPLVGAWGATTGRDGRCALDQIAGPDNLHVIPGTSTLIIAEDVDPGEREGETAMRVFMVKDQPQKASHTRRKELTTS